MRACWCMKCILGQEFSENVLVYFTATVMGELVPLYYCDESLWILYLADIKFFSLRGDKSFSNHRLSNFLIYNHGIISS